MAVMCSSEPGSVALPISNAIPLMCLRYIAPHLHLREALAKAQRKPHENLAVQTDPWEVPPTPPPPEEDPPLPEPKAPSPAPEPEPAPGPKPISKKRLVSE
jgi:hypothetical protein